MENDIIIILITVVYGYFAVKFYFDEYKDLDK